MQNVSVTDSNQYAEAWDRQRAAARGRSTSIKFLFLSQDPPSSSADADLMLPASLARRMCTPQLWRGANRKFDRVPLAQARGGAPRPRAHTRAAGFSDPYSRSFLCSMHAFVAVACNCWWTDACPVMGVYAAMKKTRIGSVLQYVKTR